MCMFCLLNLLESPPPYRIVFLNECEAPKIPIISTLTHIPWVFCRNLPSHHQISFSPPLCDFTRHSLKSSFSILFLKNIDEVQRCSELLHWIIFVIMSSEFFFILILIKSITISTTPHWNILCYLTSMYFIRLWYMWSLARCITLWLSQKIWTESYMIPNIPTNPLNHNASLKPSTAAMYSVFVVESATMSCKSVFQLIILSIAVNT